MGLVRRSAVGVGAVMLVVVASASVAMAATTASTTASPSTPGGHVAPTPRPGPCLQNAAQCAGAGSIAATTTLGLPLLLVVGATIMAGALARRARRRRRAPGLLPDGRPLTVMRPPRSLPAFA